jgi:hypothetical protein
LANKNKNKYYHAQDQKKINSGFVFSKKSILVIGIISLLVLSSGYFAIQSMIPVNRNTPFFGAPKNNFIKASYHPRAGYTFVSQSPGGARKSFGLPRANIGSGNNNNAIDSNGGPTLFVSKGGLESIHFINEDYVTHSKHNFNIDEFNVHSKDLGYFQSQAITFIVDKDGVFEYYCSIHPEMRGKVVVI